MRELEGKILSEKPLTKTEIINPFHRKIEDKPMGRVFIPAGLFLWSLNPEDGEVKKVVFHKSVMETGAANIGVNVTDRNGKVNTFDAKENQSTGMRHQVLYSPKLRYVLAINEKNARRKFEKKHYLI